MPQQTPARRRLSFCFARTLRWGTLGLSSPLHGGRGPIGRPRADALPLRRLLREAHACFPTRGGPWPRAPPRAWAPRSPGIKQGRGPHPHSHSHTRTHPILTERGHARGFASDVECSRLDQAGELARLGDACTGRSTAPRRWPPSARRRRTDIAYIVHRTHLQRSVIVHRIYIVHLLVTLYIIHTSLSLDCLSQFGQIYILATNARPRASSIVCAALEFAALTLLRWCFRFWNELRGSSPRPSSPRMHLALRPYRQVSTASTRDDPNSGA